MSVSSRVTRRVLRDKVMSAAAEKVEIATDLMIADRAFMFEDERGVPVIISEGDLVRVSHPMLKGNEEAFSPLCLVLAHDDEHGSVTVPTIGARQQSGYLQWRKMRTLANEITLPMRD